MKYTELNPSQLQAAKLINQELINIKLTNPYLRAGILAVCAKESDFEMKPEISYRNTPTQHIYDVFGTAIFAGKNVDTLKLNDEAFFNTIYYQKDLGNGPNDGYKYRGRGYNQLTGRDLYTRCGAAIGVDLVNNPDNANVPAVAAKICAWYMYQTLIQGQGLGLFTQRYKITRTSEIKDINLGATIAHQLNMGWKRVPAQDTTGGYAKTLATAPSYLALTMP
jgi:predicted chitinase